jgi:hypothetical protein
MADQTTAVGSLVANKAAVQSDETSVVASPGLAVTP